MALAAAIFSMQQPAIPFEQTPRSFGITVFIIMVMVSATQIFGIHALPTVRKALASPLKRIASWIERSEKEKVHKNKEELVTAVAQERTPNDVERATPKTSTVKTKTWMSWVTRTTTE